MNEQIALARKLGYCESVGGPGIDPGSLVPFDHRTSPLAPECVAELRQRGFEPGRINPPERPA